MPGDEMSERKTDSKTPADRKQRLTEALRANLQRRKQQARQRKTAKQDGAKRTDVPK